MFRFDIALLILLLPLCGFAKGSDVLSDGEEDAAVEEIAWSEMPDSPGAIRSLSKTQEHGWQDGFPSTSERLQSRTPPSKSSETEPYHWKGLLLLSFSFDMLSNATRIITADQGDRHLLLNKPYWSEYWASLQQFNMRRWNDGDSIKVNYIGHPMEGAIAGYIEVQNDPRGRELRISRSRPYWNSRFRAFLWETVYSTYWEIGPTGETAILNQGGFTYPIGCKRKDLACEATAKYTNNTGWVDFIITPIAGTLWLIGEDTIDSYVSDPLCGGIRMRSGLN